MNTARRGPLRYAWPTENAEVPVNQIAKAATCRAVATLLLLVTQCVSAAEVQRRTTNSGQLLMEDIPPIPARIVRDLNRFENVRSAAFRAWTADSSGLYITTRFDDVDQLHHVGHPGGARTQMTFSDEPIGEVSRQPGGTALAFTMDAGGSEQSQIFLLDPAGDNASHMLTDGESRNRRLVWERGGNRLAFTSTRRNGASNDIWVMDPAKPEDARMVLEASDGTVWSAVDFSADGKQLLVVNSVSNVRHRVYLLELDSGDRRLLAGGESPGYYYPWGFDAGGRGYWLTTDANSEFLQLAWQSLEPDTAPEFITTDIPWDVVDVVLSRDRRQGAFEINEDGFSRLYLFDPDKRQYRAVEGLPMGVMGSIRFSPDQRRLAFSISTSQTPLDTFVLDLAMSALRHGELTRWTFSEVGGLNTDAFTQPELIRFPTFDSETGGPATIPSWLYRQPGEGPHPVVISIHGGPEAQSRPYFVSTYQLWLEKLGIAVLVPNVRGSIGYGKRYQTLDDGFLREDAVRDIGALLDWIATQPDLDQDRVAVFGASYGGYMVLASAVHYSDRLRAAVNSVGISNFVTFLENTEDYRRDIRRAEYGDEQEPEMRAFLEKISPAKNAEQIRLPLFVVQGQNDPRVPVSEAEQIVAAVRNQGRPVWYMNALNEGHGFRKKENYDIFRQATVLFFEQHLLDTPESNERKQ